MRILLFTGLVAVLAYWYYREREIELYPIAERRIEVYYWLAILFSNSLGTALLLAALIWFSRPRRQAAAEPD